MPPTNDSGQDVHAPAPEAGAVVSAGVAGIFAHVLLLKAGPERDRSVSALDAFLAEPDPERARRMWLGAPLDGPMPYNSGQVRWLIVRDIAEIDRIIGVQLDAVLHHPRLQQIEASWRGLSYLVDRLEATRGGEGPPVKIRVLDASWKDVSRDIERAAEFDQSQIFKKVYDAEFGTPGGEPYGLLLGDYEVSHRPFPGHPTSDIAALDGLSHVAAAAFAPLVVGGHPGLLGLDRFSELDQPIDLARNFQQIEYVRWNSLRKSEDSRFLAITMPRILMREPYDDDGTRRGAFPYQEDMSGDEGRTRLWGTAVYLFGGVVVRAFGTHSWPAGIRGVPKNRDGGGLVTGLVTERFDTDKGSFARRCPSDVIITDRLEKELSDLGFIPVSSCRDSADLAFYSCPSIQVPQKYETAAATANARISSVLQCILTVSRFAHYLKMIGREKVGSFATAAQIESQLDAWIGKYCTRSETASADMRAQRPLSEAKIEVREHPGKPGVYACIVHLKPHFQVEHIVSAVKLVTEFAPIQQQT